MSDELATQELPLYPRWKQAVQDFLGEFQYGALVSHQWLADNLGVPLPSDRQKLTAADFQRLQFEWLSSVEAFKSELLHKHQVHLQSVRGEGYRWVPPAEQTGVALVAFERDAKRVFQQVGSRLRNLRTEELTDDQRREHIDAVTKVSSLRGMTRKALKSG
jgi:hypothetical protein